MKSKDRNCVYIRFSKEAKDWANELLKYVGKKEKLLTMSGLFYMLLIRYAEEIGFPKSPPNRLG